MKVKNPFKLFVATSIVLMIFFSINQTIYAATHTYDKLGRLIETTYNSGKTITYTYDDAGNILSVTSNKGESLSSDASLANLAVSSGTLEPVFDPAILNYAVAVPQNISEIGVTAEVKDAKATVSGTGSITLEADGATISVIVTAENGDTQTYTINVTRESAPISNDTALVSLTVDAGTLVPAFNSNIVNYDVTVPHNVSEINVFAEANGMKSTVSGTGTIALVVGGNTLSVIVTAENGDTETYTINVIRESTPISNDTALASLTVDAGTLTPAFDPGFTNYAVTVPNSISEITVTAEAKDTKATVTGTGTKTLVVGSNKIDVIVTAEDGATQTYTITVTRGVAALSGDATLSSLSVSAVTLIPAFSPDIASYMSTVAYSISGVVIKAEANNEKATVSGAGTKDLNIGGNTFDITVTAENGATNTYTINITREAIPPAENTLIVNGVEIPFKVVNGIVIIEPTQTQMGAVLSAAGSEIVFDLSGYIGVDLYLPAEWFKDTDKTITIVTAKGSDSVKTKTIWNNSGKTRLIEVRNGKSTVKNI